jgi:hypothetical protein
MLAEAHQRRVVVGADRLFDKIDAHRRQFAAAFRAAVASQAWLTSTRMLARSPSASTIARV